MIFCPNNHLVLAGNSCPQCGWVRPSVGQPGTLAWGPVTLNSMLGGERRGMLAHAAAAGGTVVVPLANSALLSIRLVDGSECWRVLLEPGCHARGLAADGERVLLAICDERLPEQAGSGWLAAVDVASGKMARLWEANNFKLVGPVLAEDRIILRTGASKLLALPLQGGPGMQPIWEAKLLSPWPSKPVVAGRRVLVSDGDIIRNEGTLSTYDLGDGHLVWQQTTLGMLDNPPAAVGGVILCQEGKNRLVWRSLADGKPMGQPVQKKIYTNLAASLGPEAEPCCFVGVRGSESPQAADHYVAQCYSAGCSQPLWQVDLPLRPKQLAFLAPNQLLVASDTGRLVCLNATDGRQLWQYELGSEEDPLRTALFVSGGRLLAGTLNGRLAAVQVAAMETEKPGDPEDYLQKGQKLPAAESYALHGQFGEAAGLFAELNEPYKAIALYERGKSYLQAAELALQLKNYDSALNDFKLANSLSGQARVLEAKNDLLSAAALYEQAGNQRKAAECYEVACDYFRAYRLYDAIGDEASAERALIHVPEKLAIDALEAKGRCADAADLAERAGDLERAAKLYEKASLPEREKAVLYMLVRHHPDQWAFERLAELYHQSGQTEDEIRVLRDLLKYHQSIEGMERVATLYHQSGRYQAEIEMLQQMLDHRLNLDLVKRLAALAGQLGQFKLAGDTWVRYCATYDEDDLTGELSLNVANAYFEAALQARKREAKHSEVASLYRLAKQWYDRTYLDAAKQYRLVCERSINYFSHLPCVTVSGQITSGFVEEQFNTLRLMVKNEGFSAAIEVRFSVDEALFDLNRGAWDVLTIPPNEEMAWVLSLRPRKGVSGKVALVLSWSWKDRQGQQYSHRVIIDPVNIKAKDESASGKSTQPHIYVINGDFIQAEGHVIHGDNINGDQVKGDKIAGDKGDHIVVGNTGNGVDVMAAVEGQKPTCPQCSRVTRPENTFCTGCGRSLKD